MAAYNIDADAAFEVLKRRSQHTNTKLRVVAEQLMNDFRSMHEVFVTAQARDNDV